MSLLILTPGNRLGGFIEHEFLELRNQSGACLRWISSMEGSNAGTEFGHTRKPKNGPQKSGPLSQTFLCHWLDRQRSQAGNTRGHHQQRALFQENLFRTKTFC